MCLNLIHVKSKWSAAKGTVVIRCGKCWQCRGRRLDDFVGRCIAEAETSDHVYVVGLTYRDEALASDGRVYGLNYRDVQHYLKVLRKQGLNVRYFVCGEFGAIKGRPHWHIVLFFKGDPPVTRRWKDAGGNYYSSYEDGRELVSSPIRLDWDYEDGNWHHGMCHWQKANPSNIRYALKYITKDQDKAKRDGDLPTRWGMSKFPPLGSEYFFQLAEKHVLQMLAPQNAKYTFPIVDPNTGKRKCKKFYLKGVMLDRYLEYYLELWAGTHGNRHVPSSEFLEKWQDKQKPFEWACGFDASGKYYDELFDLRRKRFKRWPGDPPSKSPSECEVLESTAWTVRYWERRDATSPFRPLPGYGDEPRPKRRFANATGLKMLPTKQSVVG